MALDTSALDRRKKLKEIALNNLKQSPKIGVGIFDVVKEIPGVVGRAIKETAGDISGIAKGIDDSRLRRAESALKVIDDPTATKTQKVIRSGVEGLVFAGDIAGDIVIGAGKALLPQSVENKISKTFSKLVGEVANNEIVKEKTKEAVNWYKSLPRERQINYSTTGLLVLGVSDWASRGRASKLLSALKKETDQGKIIKTLVDDFEIDETVANRLAPKISNEKNKAVIKDDIQKATVETAKLRTKPKTDTSALTRKTDVSTPTRKTDVSTPTRKTDVSALTKSKQVVDKSTDLSKQQLPERKLKIKEIQSSINVIPKSKTVVNGEIAKSVDNKIDGFLNGQLSEAKLTPPEKALLEERLKQEAFAEKNNIKSKTTKTPNTKIRRVDPKEVRSKIVDISKKLPKDLRGRLLTLLRDAKNEKHIEKAERIVRQIRERGVDRINSARERAQAIKDIIEGKIEPIKIGKDFSKRELGVEKINILEKELPGEFAVGKMEKAQKNIEKNFEKVFEGFGTLKLDDAELEAFYSFRESDDILKRQKAIEKLSKHDLDKLEETNEAITKLTKHIDDRLEELGLLEQRLDEETYIRAFLRNTDGTPASLEKLTELRIDQGANFRELLSSASQKIGAKDLKQTRKYRNADERDAVLAKYGLKTDRNIKRVMVNYVDSMSQLIGKTTFNNTIRAIARSGKKSNVLREVYDPKSLQGFRKKLAEQVKNGRERLLKLAKENRVLTDREIQRIQRSKETLLEVDDPDILKELEIGAKDINEFFNDIILSLKEDKKGLKIREEITRAKENAIKALREEYGRIAREKAELEKDGFKSLDVPGAETLRGVMGKERERDFVREIVDTQKRNTVIDNLDQINQTGKLAMAVGDMFSIPRVWWLNIQASGGLGIKDSTIGFWNDLTGRSRKALTDEDIAEASEFMQLDRMSIGDVDTLKKIESEMNGELTTFEKFVKKVDDITDIKGIEEAKEGVKGAFTALENYQFKVLLTGAKVRLWKAIVRNSTMNGTPLREAQIEAGKLIDTLSGVSNFKKIMAKYPKAFSKSVQKGLRISLFAPNLFLTTAKMLKTYGIDIFASGAKGALARSATIKMLLYTQIALQTASYSLNGHSTFENDDKKKILALKVPGALDEKGNQYYLNPLGWIVKPFDIMMRPLESVANRMALLPRFALNLFSSPYKYENQAESRIGNAIDGVIPLPFSMQTPLRYALAQTGDDPKYGVAKTPQQMMALSLLEFVGFEGVYTSGKSKTTVATDVIKQALKAFDDPTNWDLYLDPIYIENYLLSKELPDTRSLIKSKYNIQGNTSSDDFIEAVKKIPKEKRDLFINTYSEKTQKLIRRKIGEVQEDSPKGNKERALDALRNLGGDTKKSKESALDALRNL